MFRMNPPSSTRHTRLGLAAATLLGVCLTLVACGIATSAPGGPDLGASGTRGRCGTPPGAPPIIPSNTGIAVGVATPVYTMVVTPHATPRGGTPQPNGPPPATLPPSPASPGATVPPGPVTVRTDHVTYQSCALIQVAVANGLPQTVYALDHQSACTLVALQVQAGAGWLAVDRCALETPTGPHPIAAGSTSIQILRPGVGSGQPPRAEWQPGTYRIAFSYLLRSEPTATQRQTVYSATFTIG
jgi:hypothetical protein